MSAGVSVHAVDVSSGLPARGLGVRLSKLEPGGLVLLAEGRCAAGGALEHPALSGDAVTVGRYAVEFDVAEFFRGRGAALPGTPFLDVAVYRFGIGDASQHYHLPFKFTAWGYSLFRGGL